MNIRLKNSRLALLGGKPVLKRPLPPYNSLGVEEKCAALEVMKERVLSDFLGTAGEKFLGGKYVRKFEENVCRTFKVKYAVSFNSATTALQAAVTTLGIGPGDEVITTPFTMSATASAILFNGAVPVFADIDDENYCISPQSIEKNISRRTKAILVVNLFGGSCDFSSILSIAKKHNLKIIEDNAQSIGARYNNKYLGTIGDIGVFSFNVHKILQAGEGGALVTNNRHLAYLAQLVRNHGELVIDDTYNQDKKYEALIGNNFRMTELTAAIAHAQLKKITKLIQSRIQLANYLSRKLKIYTWLEPPHVFPRSRHVYYVYPFKFFKEKIGIKRSTFAHAMAAEGFPIVEGYVKPVHLMQLYQRKKIFPRSHFPFRYDGVDTKISYKKGICPTAERLYKYELLTVDICYYPRTSRDIDLFIQALEKIEKNHKSLRMYEKKNK